MTDIAGRDQPAQTARRLSCHIEAPALDPGLYLVATPIGAARDITLRALDVLNAADMLAAEDTRVMRHLMDIHGIPLRGRKILSYHDHNADRQRPAILAALAAGKSVAYASDAGTPLVADPGYRLARDAAQDGWRVHAVPGASAALVALSLSGLPSDRFMFAGFPPAARSARQTWLKEIASVDATLILFESPRRVNQILDDLYDIDPNRITVIARELTKRFEEVIRGPVAELRLDPRIEHLKGEVVLVIDRPGDVKVDEALIRQALSERLSRMTVRDAAREVSEIYSLTRREVYQLALDLKG